MYLTMVMEKLLLTLYQATAEPARASNFVTLSPPPGLGCARGYGVKSHVFPVMAVSGVQAA